MGYMDVYLNSLFTSIDTCTSLAQLGIETDAEPLTADLLILIHSKTFSKLLFNEINKGGSYEKRLETHGFFHG